MNLNMKKHVRTAAKIAVGTAIVIPAFVAGKAVGAVAGAGIGLYAAWQAGDWIVDHAQAALEARGIIKSCTLQGEPVTVSSKDLTTEAAEAIQRVS